MARRGFGFGSVVRNRAALGGGGITFDGFAAMFDTEKLGGTGSATKVLLLPIAAGPEIDWGDGTINNLNTHTYSTGGEWFVQSSDAITDFRFNNGGDCLKLIDMVSLGDGFEINNSSTWHGCNNMVYSTTDTPIINTTNLSNTFSGCSSMNGGDLSNWDMSLVLNMTNMFFQADSFTGSGIENWNVGSCTNFTQCFFGADSLAAPIGVWNMISAKNIGGMFRSNTGFNQDIDAWDVSNVQQMNHVFAGATSFTYGLPNWNVGSATTCHAMFRSNYNGDISTWVFTSSISDMSWMFASNNTFNQDISGWNVASVTNMSNMFGSCDDFNQDLTGWNVGSCTNMSTMLDDCGMSQANYDKWLLNLDAQTLKTSVPLGANNLVYTGFGAPAAARASLVGAPDLMTITGDKASQVPDSAYNFTKFSDLIPGSGANDVLAWVDYVGIDNLAQPTGVNQPLFNGDHIELNGGDYLNQLIPQAGDFTYITKFKSTSDAIQVLLGDASNTNVYVALISELFRYKPSSGTSHDTSLVYNNTGPHIATITKSGSDIKVYIEEDEVLSVSDASAIELDRVGDRGGSSLGFVGNLYHLLSYSVALSPTEIQQQIEALDVL